MVVRTRMRLGRAVSALAAEMARSIAVVVAPVDRLDVPAVALEPLGDVLPGEGEVGLAVDGDAVVVVEVDEPPELVVAGEAGRLGRDALHEVAVEPIP